MHSHIELLKVIKQIVEDPWHNESTMQEILESFARGSFGVIISDPALEKLGGKKEVQKMSKEILAEEKLLHSITNSNQNNNEKTSKK